jgi:hypothetical protein
MQNHKLKRISVLKSSFGISVHHNVVSRRCHTYIALTCRKRLYVDLTANKFTCISGEVVKRLSSVFSAQETFWGTQIKKRCFVIYLGAKYRD